MARRKRHQHGKVGVRRDDDTVDEKAGRSAGVKAYLHRQVGVFGRRGFVTDVKREYPPLAAASLEPWQAASGPSGQASVVTWSPPPQLGTSW